MPLDDDDDDDDDADDEDAAAWVATRPAFACSRPTRPLIDDEPDADDEDELRKVTVAGAPCDSSCSIVVCASTRRPPTSARSEARAEIQRSTAACSNDQTQ